MIKPIAWCPSQKKLHLVSICSLLLILLVFVSCTNTSIPSSSHEYTETQIVVSEGDIYRFDIFANEDSIIEVHWKPDTTVYCWYTDPVGLAKPLYDYGTGPDGELASWWNDSVRIGNTFLTFVQSGLIHNKSEGKISRTS